MKLWRSQDLSIGTNHDPFQLSLNNTFSAVHNYTKLTLLLDKVGYLVWWACLVGKVGIMWLVHNTATHNSGRWPQMALMSVSLSGLELVSKSPLSHKHCLSQVFLDFHVTDKPLLPSMRGKRPFNSEITSTVTITDFLLSLLFLDQSLSCSYENHCCHFARKRGAENKSLLVYELW